MINQGRKKSKSFFFFLNTVLILVAVFWGYAHFSKGDGRDIFSEAKGKQVFLNLDGLEFFYRTDSRTVSEFVAEHSLEITQEDAIVPGLEDKLTDGSRIYIQKSRKMIVSEGGEEKEIYTLRATVGEAVREKSELNVGEDDILKPEGDSLVEDGIEVAITHVKVEEEKKQEPIVFKTITNEDDKLGWREKKVTQKGVRGTSEVTYKVVYHNEEEISRKKIKEEVVEEPVSEIVTQGTYVKVGKEKKGKASYYARSWGTLNASRDIPRGSYAKVTNLENGKSVIIKINDYGPQSPDRIIDMDYVSFSKIGDLATGIIHRVKVEQVLN